ncbi:MAG: hypothetical protein K9I71_04570 [Ignavibacteriales bacterium]|nr:hypothetical protein [Ignavibacteriales bacterium]MCF8315372.1 hypothetical protein [Ignavibacteriales bacterium]MCF8436736.1 hypothetical protein [Ignavibacteriales bacterium]
MNDNFKSIIKSKRTKVLLYIFGVVAIIVIALQFFYEDGIEWYTGVINEDLTYDTSVELTEGEFRNLVNDIIYNEKKDEAKRVTAGVGDELIRQERIQILLNTPSFRKETKFQHIKYFDKAGIRQYEGPSTCLTCHETMQVKVPGSPPKDVNTMDDIINSVHFRFHQKATGFTTIGFDGRQVNEKGRKIPVGKIDRACGIPGSFSWTGWAALIKTYPESANGNEVLRSEGCGQCHIGGNYHPATETMLPDAKVPESAEQGIDCLICHSQQYDFNQKFVLKDEYGMRWNQDRSLRAAITVTNPEADNCLYCHQHNMGGDAFEGNKAAKSLGHQNQRLLHEGSKRGNAFSPGNDVHSAAGMNCTDCHRPEGHKIPRGNKGTDLVANDLPGKIVSCENCHTYAPHISNSIESVMLNGHVERLACETCHIKELEHTNVVLRDWTNPHWDKEEGMYVPTDILRSGEINIGFTFYWFNGNGTFLANAIGSNPSNDTVYNPLMDRMTKLGGEKAIRSARENVLDLLKKKNIQVDDYMNAFLNTLSQLSPEQLKRREDMVREKILPAQKTGESKIYPFKLFNSRMYEDLGNEGPFGGMILPFDYQVYYETGKPLDAVKKAISHPIIKRMYELPFKEYMMDEFMKYFGAGEWKTEFPLTKDGKLKNVEARWMRQYGTLMVNHGISKAGRTCTECHSPDGIMNFEELGYTHQRAEELRKLPEMKYFKNFVTKK